MAEEKKEPVKVKCPCCGELTLTQPLDVKSAVLDEYMAAIITGVPFAHTYGLYNGSVKITVESLHHKDSILLSNTENILKEYIKNMESEGGNQVKAGVGCMKELLGTLRLYFGVTAIEMYRDKALVKSYTPSEIMRTTATDICAASLAGNSALDEAVAKATKTCLAQDATSTLPSDAIKAIVVTHGDLYNLLMDAGFDENFWAGIELA